MSKLSENRDKQMHLMFYMGACYGAYEFLSPEEKESLNNFQDGSRAGFDWPGWRKHGLWRVRPPHLDEPHVKQKQVSVSTAKRIRVYRRDGFRCKKCGTTENLSIDHVIPISKGGSNDEDNLQTLCWTCNVKKGARLD